MIARILTDHTSKFKIPVYLQQLESQEGNQ